MKISVLMSVYAKEKEEYLEESIKSVINQTIRPDQIVIIKDGILNDGLEKVLNKYKANFPELIDIYSIKEHQGLGAALNFGVLKCKNEYIARMDTDDISVPNRFEKQIEKLKEHPDIDILGGYIEEYEEDMKEFISIRKVPLTNEGIREYAKRQAPFNHMTVIIKKQTLLDIGSYTNEPIEDYVLWIKMIVNNCNMANIEDVLCKVRTGKSMYKRRSGLKRIKNMIYIEKMLLDNKIINKIVYIENIIIRTIVALTPVTFKKFVYSKLIRKKKLVTR